MEYSPTVKTFLEKTASSILQKQGYLTPEEQQQYIDKYYAASEDKGHGPEHITEVRKNMKALIAEHGYHDPDEVAVAARARVEAEKPPIGVSPQETTTNRFYGINDAKMEAVKNSFTSPGQKAMERALGPGTAYSLNRLRDLNAEQDPLYKNMQGAIEKAGTDNKSYLFMTQDRLGFIHNGRIYENSSRRAFSEELIPKEASLIPIMVKRADDTPEEAHVNPSEEKKPKIHTNQTSSNFASKSPDVIAKLLGVAKRTAQRYKKQGTFTSKVMHKTADKVTDFNKQLNTLDKNIWTGDADEKKEYLSNQVYKGYSKVPELKQDVSKAVGMRLGNREYFRDNLTNLLLKYRRNMLPKTAEDPIASTHASPAGTPPPDDNLRDKSNYHAALALWQKQQAEKNPGQKMDKPSYEPLNSQDPPSA